MTGGGRILPFLGASVAVHVIAIGAFSADPLNISVSSRGTDHEVSIRLEAAAPTATAANGREQPAESNPDSGQAARTTETTSSPTQAQKKREIDTAAQAAPAPAEPERAVAEKPDEAPETREEDVESRKRAERDDARPRDARRIARIEESATGSASVNSDATRAEAREALVAEVAKYFHYPRLARRRGWEGTVVLSVRILPDGRLENIRVLRSSGRALLDRSAAGSLGHVQRLPEFANRVGDTGLALEIPVTYRLESA